MSFLVQISIKTIMSKNHRGVGKKIGSRDRELENGDSSEFVGEFCSKYINCECERCRFV